MGFFFFYGMMNGRSGRLISPPDHTRNISPAVRRCQSLLGQAERREEQGRKVLCRVLLLNLLFTLGGDSGFARIRCPDCRMEHLLTFSCRTRGFCPSCHAERIEERGTVLDPRRQKVDSPCMAAIDFKPLVSSKLNNELTITEV
jgi:ribosomal protein S27E